MDTNTPSDTKNSDTKNTEASSYLTPIAVVLGAIIIAVAFYFGHGGAPVPTSGQPTSGQTQTAVNISDVKTAGEPYIGSKDAPVTMALWFDYQCPFCKLLDTNSMPELYTNYIKTGKLRVVFKDFAFLGPDSDAAGLFARALWDLYPNRFYAWYQAMYAAQDGENSGFGNMASIEKLAKTFPGINEAKVVTQMNSHKSEYAAAMSADRAEGERMGVRGTPSFIIGTHLSVGAQPYSKISALINAQLQKVKN